MLDRLKDTVKSLVGHLSNDEMVVDVIKEGDVFKVTIQTKDEVALIGKDNERFNALSHILKKILTKIIDVDSRIVIDINNLRGKNDDALKAKASILAERARAFKKDVELDPMTSYERRVVHSFLEGSPSIRTESIGEGSQRRLIIKYIEERPTV